MKESIQLRIPTACGEDWERMDRAERGRFCQQCQKTVVDFTGMTDEEVLGYFAAASRGAASSGAASRRDAARDDASETDGSGVCGRFLPGQLGRDLVPAPVQRNGWSGWRWVLASALMLVRPPEGSRPVKAVAVEHRVKGDTVLELNDVTAGMVVRVVKEPKMRRKIARFVRDSMAAWKPSIARLDAVKGPEVAGEIPAVNGVMQGAGDGLSVYMGAVSAGSSVRVDTTILQKVVDTVSAWAPLRREDLVTLYPNPVERGGVLHLAWLSEEGKYQLTLLSMRGQLVAERVMEVSGAGQVDQWVLPVGLAAGVYALRLAKDGGGKVMVREVVVR